MDLQLSGLVAVVTGASKGIGLARARRLLEEGARVVAVSRSTSDDRPRFGFADLTDDDWAQMFELSLFPTGRAIRAAIPAMHPAEAGRSSTSPPGTRASRRASTSTTARRRPTQGRRVNTVSPGPVRTAWWTDEGGAADILAAYAGTGRDDVRTRSHRR